MNQREVIETAEMIVEGALREASLGCDASMMEAVRILYELLSYKVDPDVALGWWSEWLSK